jgi:hypothetical protein
MSQTKTYSIRFEDGCGDWWVREFEGPADATRDELVTIALDLGLIDEREAERLRAAGTTA